MRRAINKIMLASLFLLVMALCFKGTETAEAASSNLVTEAYTNDNTAVFYLSDEDGTTVYKYTISEFAGTTNAKDIEGLYSRYLPDVSDLLDNWTVELVRGTAATASFEAPEIVDINLYISGSAAREIDWYFDDGTTLTETHDEYLSGTSKNYDTGRIYDGISIQFEGFTTKTGYHVEDTNVLALAWDEYKSIDEMEESHTYNHVYDSAGNWDPYQDLDSCAVYGSQVNFKSIKSGYAVITYYDQDSSRVKTKTQCGVYHLTDDSSFDADNGTMTLNGPLNYFGGLTWNDCVNTSTAATNQVTNDVTVYVLTQTPNEYTVTADANWGTLYDYVDGNNTWTNITSFPVEYDSSQYDNIGGFAPYREGYTFEGWYTDRDGGVQVYDANGYRVNGTGYWNNGTWCYDGDVTVYAHWTANVCIVTADANWGTLYNYVNGNNTWTNITSFPVEYGTNLYDNIGGFSPYRTGYIFQGWYADSSDPSNSSGNDVGRNGGVQVYDANGYRVNGTGFWSSGTWCYDGNVVVFAHWTPITYYIDYAKGSTNYSGSVPSSTACTYDSNVTLATYGSMKGRSYTLSFNSNKPSTSSQTPTTKGSLTGNLSFSSWKIGNHTYSSGQTLTTPNFTSTNGGRVTATAQWISKTLGNFGELSMTGYTFDGWYTEASGGTRTESVTIDPSTSAYSKTLYAHWTPNTYTVRFDSNTGNGGTSSGSMSSITLTYDAAQNLPACTFTRDNGWGESVFLGWSTDPDATAADFGDGESVVNLTDENGGTVTLYAIWDDCPWIVAEDLYYTLEQAQSGYITHDELMSHASADDREDGSPIEPGVNNEKGTIFYIWDYSESDFTQFQHAGSVTETYYVQDHVGGVYKKMITVHIVDTTAETVEPVGTTRFINGYYYYQPYEYGGLEDNSIWKTDPEYAAVLLEAFDNLKNDTPIATYYFTHEDILEMKEYVEEHGIGNSQEPDALSNFYDLFMAPNKID